MLETIRKEVRTFINFETKINLINTLDSALLIHSIVLPLWRSNTKFNLHIFLSKKKIEMRILYQQPRWHFFNRKKRKKNSLILVGRSDRLTIKSRALCGHWLNSIYNTLQRTWCLQTLYQGDCIGRITCPGSSRRKFFRTLHLDPHSCQGKKNTNFE